MMGLGEIPARASRNLGREKVVEQASTLVANKSPFLMHSFRPKVMSVDREPNGSRKGCHPHALPVPGKLAGVVTPW